MKSDTNRHLLLVLLRLTSLGSTTIAFSLVCDANETFFD